MKEKDLEDIVKSVIDTSGFILDHIEYITQGKRWILRVYIDKEGGVSLEDCGNVSIRLGRRLDDENVIPHAYLLEISSPGLDRPLRKFDDYIRYVGRLIKLNTRRSYDNHTTFKGRIISAEDEKITLETEKSGRVVIHFSDIANARLEIEF